MQNYKKISGTEKKVVIFFIFSDKISILLPRFCDMKIKKIIINIVIFLVLLLPFWLWLAWKLSPHKHLSIFIADKTVLTEGAPEHSALNMILTREKYVKPDGDFYSASKDYSGFFPLENFNYIIKDLSAFNSQQIDSIAGLYEMAYFTDMYGISKNEWYCRKSQTAYSEKLYGGMDENDYLFLKKMKEKKKLVISEFNLFAPPTTPDIREKTEELLGLKWSGWTGRYFELLDTVKNPGLPRWVISLYKLQHQNKWPFSKSGIVFVNENKTIAILENETHLYKELPRIFSFPYTVEKFGVTKEINYPYWFDITLSADSGNKILSYYEIFPNKKGDSVMQHHSIPKIFPATFGNIKGGQYYFCGDFSDCPVQNWFVKLKWISFLQMLVLDKNDVNDRTPFFWNYYCPMVKKIIDDYYEEIKKG